MASMTFNSVGPVAFTVAGQDIKSIATAVPMASLGERMISGGEEYVLVYNAGTGTISQKLGCKLITGASGYSVAVTSVANTLNPCVGVAKHCDIPASEYGWVLTRGFCTVEVVTAMTGDYRMIALGANGQFIEASGTTTMGTATVVGYLLSHNASAGSAAYAFIKTGA